MAAGGPAKVLKDICGLNEDNPLFPLIISFYDLLGQGVYSRPPCSKQCFRTVPVKQFRKAGDIV